MADSPISLGAKWLEHVNRPQTRGEVEQIRQCVERGQPYALSDWQRKPPLAWVWSTPSDCKADPRKANNERVEVVPSCSLVDV
jgi:hypothetical protein